MAMVKAFDTADLGERLKAKGLPMLEADVKIATTEFLSWIEESLALEAASNPVYAIGVPLVEAIKPAILQLEDKIDGVSGN